MSRPLPPNPNLRQLKQQAKDLRKARATGETEAIARIREHLPRCSQSTDEQIRDEPFSLQEAQHVVACEHGFKNWEMLCAVVEADLDILSGLTDREIQEVLRAVDQKDFVIAFHSDETALIREQFLNNTSLRVRTFLLEEIEFKSPPSPEEATAARRRILQHTAELAAQGKLDWPKRKDHLLVEMKKAIEAAEIDLFSFLSDQEAQTVMREIDQKDMTAALIGAGQAVQDKFLLNMSSRVRAFIRAEMEMSNADESRIRDARRRILLQAALLVQRRAILWPDGKPRTEPARVAPDFVPSGNLDQLADRPLDQLTPEDLVDLMTALSAQAQSRGILSISTYAESTADPFLRQALLLAVDGCAPELMRDMLETRLEQAILPHLKTRGLMVTEGTVFLNNGDNPLVIRHKLSMYIPQPSPDWSDLDLDNVTVESLHSSLRDKPVDRMTLEELTDLYAQMAGLSHSALRDELLQKRDFIAELMRHGLDMLLDRADSGHISRSLRNRLDAYLDASEKTHRMVIEGVCAIQEGKNPEDVAAIVRAVGENT